MAGPEACEFCSSTSDTEALLRKKFDSLLLDLKKQPIAVLPLTGHSSAYIPNIVTASDLLNYLQASTYTPVQYWPAVAGILRDLSSGNGTSLSIVKENRFKEKTPCATCEDPYSPSCQLPNLGDDPTKSGSVWCSDGPDYRIPGPEYMDTSLKLLEEQSPLFGAMWAEIKMQCLAWDVKPTWKYPGKFQDIETSHPIMWIGTTGDHVCPLAKYVYLSHLLSIACIFDNIDT
jgi:TAP-like protein